MPKDNLENLSTLDIMALEEKVRQIHLNPPVPKLQESTLSAKDTLTMFWDFHVKPVIEIVKTMACKYCADYNSLWLAAILHDIARAHDKEPHDEVGAEMAYDFLRDNGLSAYHATPVRAIILTHSCKKHKPESLEQKVLATADAVAHFQHPFYLWYHTISPEPFEKLLAWNLKKIERDFRHKIFFKEERESVRRQYETMRQWCTR